MAQQGEVPRERVMARLVGPEQLAVLEQDNAVDQLFGSLATDGSVRRDQLMWLVEQCTVHSPAARKLDPEQVESILTLITGVTKKQRASHQLDHSSFAVFVGLIGQLLFASSEDTTERLLNELIPRITQSARHLLNTRAAPRVSSASRARRSKIVGRPVAWEDSLRYEKTVVEGTLMAGAEPYS